MQPSDVSPGGHRPRLKASVPSAAAAAIWIASIPWDKTASICAGEARARGWSDRLVLACLLHDASEAYISDIIRPVKIHLDNYREIEDRIMAVILEAFGLPTLPGGKCFRKQIDDDMLRGELRGNDRLHRELPPILAGIRPDFAEHPHWETEEAFLKEE